MRSRHVSTVIRRPPAHVYDFASDPANLPAWAAGLATAEATGGGDADGDTLVVDSPMGRARIRFVPRNDLGVLDHEVSLPDGITVYNPLRILPHPHGSEVVMTIRQLTDDDDEFEQDAAAVAADLDRLKDLLEVNRPSSIQPPRRNAVQTEVRIATPADARSLGSLLYEFNTEFSCPTPSAAEAAGRFERLLERDDVLAVVARRTDVDHLHGADIGFAFLTLRPTPLWDGPLAQLEELYIRGDLRSGGVGTAIVELALSESAQRGCQEMLINVDSDDLGARRFYDRHGFSEIDPDSGSRMRCLLRQL